MGSDRLSPFDTSFAPFGLDQGALPLGTLPSPPGGSEGREGGQSPCPCPRSQRLRRSTAVNGSLRRVLTRSVLAVPAALRMRLPRPPLTAAPLQNRLRSKRPSGFSASCSGPCVTACLAVIHRIPLRAMWHSLSSFCRPSPETSVRLTLGVKNQCPHPSACSIAQPVGSDGMPRVDSGDHQRAT